MDQQKRLLLERAGIDVADALARFMDNEALMLKFLLRFPEDKNFSQLEQALADGDATRAFEAAHTLKGVAGKPVHDAAVSAGRPFDGGSAAAGSRGCQRQHAGTGGTVRTHHFRFA